MHMTGSCFPNVTSMVKDGSHVAIRIGRYRHFQTTLTSSDKYLNLPSKGLNNHLDLYLNLGSIFSKGIHQSSLSVPHRVARTMSEISSGSAATTYQSVIIALLAGGILSTALITFLIRRRQRRAFLRRVRGGGQTEMRFVLNADGTVYSVPGDSGREGNGIGKEPGLWDATVCGQDGGEERVGDSEMKKTWQVSTSACGVRRYELRGCLLI